ncbi:MAG TPA: SRPBCC domain-containing protein, partial [Longimicrobiales bacterium]|nr:SRPBCC domain-containing protein [Longimicrobiales bacterium]
MTEHLPAVERSVWLPARPEVVWRFLTSGVLVADWFGGPVSMEARPGAGIEFRPGDGELRWGTVEDVATGKRIQWTWRTDEGEPSEVAITLDGEGDGTRVTVVERLVPYV